MALLIPINGDMVIIKMMDGENIGVILIKTKFGGV